MIVREHESSQSAEPPTRVVDAMAHNEHELQASHHRENQLLKTAETQLGNFEISCGQFWQASCTHMLPLCERYATVNPMPA